LDTRKSYSKDEIVQRVRKVAQLLHMEELLDRKPGELSGGQAQRVALGRAIVMEPDAFLMDEPLANLDAALRVEMRTEIKRIQRKLSTSTIFVTHDQEEALTLGDKIAVMKDGVVQQVGTPNEIYLTSENIFVGAFIGSPPINLLPCSTHSGEGEISVVSDLFHVQVPKVMSQELSKGSGDITLGVRPEFVSLGQKGRDSFQAHITLIEPLGSRTVIFLEAQGQEVRSVIQGESRLKEGESVSVTFQMEKALFFDSSGKRICGKE
jgi:multiple sugar transport system ATP-binding protein